ncbi:BnaC09g42970D [Brassica napus]|uniref:BnaC09g42970D protein n=1 Tax=Brassica napus TaxID=3708 RepID=A0A078FA33_BRANA|nr:BnaC09g42970D [Brassica napus]
MAKEYNEALLEKHYHEGCPGCKVEKMKEVRRGYPYLELSFIWIVILSTCKFVFLFFRGLLVTILGLGLRICKFVHSCAFMFGRALTSIFWGIMADRYGRKPIILLGTITIAVFNALFGMSTNIWMASATRFMLGSFNCLVGTMKGDTLKLSLYIYIYIYNFLFCFLFFIHLSVLIL